MTGLPTTVEVATGKQVQDALTFDGDVLWIGARTTVNPFSVQELADALRGVQLEPVHGPLRAVFADGRAAALIDGSATRAQLDALEGRFAGFLAAIAEATAREEGKPEGALPKIVEGRVNGFFKDRVLLEQSSVQDSKKTVKAYATENGAEITGFVRIEIGG